MHENTFIYVPLISDNYSYLHRWVAQSDCDHINPDQGTFKLLYADGTGYKRRPDPERNNWLSVKVMALKARVKVWITADLMDCFQALGRGSSFVNGSDGIVDILSSNMLYTIFNRLLSRSV